jgi:hypothetical protein
VVDRQPAASSAGRSTERRAAYRPLLDGVRVVESAAVIAACTGPGTIIPACLRIASRSATSAGSPVTNPARYPARLDRLDSECTASTPVVRPAAHVRVQHRDRRGVPAELDVALVGGEHRAALAAHSTASRSCSAGSTRPVGLDGEFTQASRTRSAAGAGRRRSASAATAGPASRAPMS